MQQPRPGRQQGKQFRIENAAGFFRQRQQANENIRPREKTGKLIRAMKAGDAVDLLPASAPGSEGKAKRQQSLDSRLRQHAKAEKAYAALGGLRSGKTK